MSKVTIKSTKEQDEDFEAEALVKDKSELITLKAYNLQKLAFEDHQILMDIGHLLRPLSVTKSLPASLHANRTSNNATRLLSLNENKLSHGRQRSQTFAARPKRWDEQSLQPEHRFSVPNLRKPAALDYDRYSPKLTQTIPLDPVEHFHQQNDLKETKEEFGRVKIMFQYFNKLKKFKLKLLRVCDVASGVVSPLGVYAEICLIQKTKQRELSRHKYNATNPVFNEQFHFQTSLGKLMESKLRIQLFNKPRRFSVSKQIGLCVLDLSNYDLTTVTVLWEDLNETENKERYSHQLEHNKNGTLTGWRDLLCGTACSHRT